MKTMPAFYSTERRYLSEANRERCWQSLLLNKYNSAFVRGLNFLFFVPPGRICIWASPSACNVHDALLTRLFFSSAENAFVNLNNCEFRFAVRAHSTIHILMVENGAEELNIYVSSFQHPPFIILRNVMRWKFYQRPKNILHIAICKCMNDVIGG